MVQTLLIGERTRPRVQFPASRRKTLFGETPNTTRGDAYAPQTLCAERYYGKIQRAFTLSQEVDEATAQAKYNDGVLELTLPKKTVATAKRLAVH